MNRIAVAQELVKLARELTAAGEKLPRELENIKTSVFEAVNDAEPENRREAQKLADEISSTINYAHDRGMLVEYVDDIIDYMKSLEKAVIGWSAGNDIRALKSYASRDEFTISFDEGNLTDAIFNGVALEVHFTGDKADARKLAKEIIQATKKYAPKE